VFAGACTFTLASVTYVHWSQEQDRIKMYQNVLNDIQQEMREKEQDEACTTGICDLKQSRIIEK